jgi:hypothetical protein
MKIEQGVPKRWYLNYRRRGITQKKAYYKQYLLIVWSDPYMKDKIVILVLQ